MSKEKLIKLASGFSIGANDYANQANAILGIRDAGKTYTAMKVAEQLMDCQIPIIVFDPVGIWKNLKIGVGNHKGYAIVVAGGEGSDIRLTKENAVDIVRAAMKENISLVIDLYSPELINKSTWIVIVQSVVDLLMYENKAYNLRHIFVEEAAEFIPQRLQPQHSKVYAAIERLARMGRNAKLGMTIINQRAEEVNKAILEICELSLIHKQVGKNSMMSIQKWLEIRQLENAKEIIGTLPHLGKGECWAIGHGVKAHKIQVLPKVTYHPDPKANDKTNGLVGKLAMDVTGFVVRLNDQLLAEKEKRQAPKPITQKQTNSVNSLLSEKDANLITSLRGEVALLKEQLKQKGHLIMFWKNTATGFRSRLEKIRRHITDIHIPESFLEIKEPENKLPESGVSLSTIVNKSVQKTAATPRNPQPVSSSDEVIPGAAKKIILFLAQFPDREFSKVQIAVATDYKQGGGSFNNALYRLNSLGWIIKGDKYRVNPDAKTSITDAVGEIPDKKYGYETFKNQLAKAEKEIYEGLIADPYAEFTKEELAERTATGYEPSGGSFNNALYRLNTLELLRRANGIYKLNPELLELMA